VLDDIASILRERGELTAPRRRTRVMPAAPKRPSPGRQNRI
jgi:hypothetical protein